MKKRSLVAALAMLMVSAIVLTSSTYAWFASSSQATVSSFEATVTNNQGALTVQATGAAAVENAQKKVSLTSADYKPNALATTLSPVSLSISDAGEVAVGVATYEEGKYKAFTPATANTQYLTYSFIAEYKNAETSAKTVTMTPEWVTAATKGFCYGIVEVDDGSTSKFYFYNASGTYTPVTAIAADIDDSTGTTADIIDAADKGYENATMAKALTELTDLVVPTTSNTLLNIMTVDGGATKAVTINVYVWAEGQDADCSGTVASATSYFDFDLGIAA